MLTRASNVVLANILPFMWESTWNGGLKQKPFSSLYNLPKIMGKSTIIKLPKKFQASIFFQCAPKIWAEIKSFLNLSNVPEVIGQYKNSQNAQNYFWSIRIFPDCQRKIWQQWIFKKNCIFLIFQTARNFLSLLENFLWIFSSFRIFQVPKFLSRDVFFSNLYNLPEIIEQKFPNCRNFLKHPGKHFSGKVQNDQSFWAPWKTFHTYP